MKKKFKKLFLIIFSFSILLYLLITYLFGSSFIEIIKKNISIENKKFIKEKLFPYQLISRQSFYELNLDREQLFSIKGFLSEKELIFKKSLREIPVKKIEEIQLSNQMLLEKYRLIDGFYSGIKNKFPGSGYIDFHNDNLVILSARGVLSFTSDIYKEKNFAQIENNINNFIDLKQYIKSAKFSLKDLLIHKDNIFISFTEEIKNDCWNVSVISGNFNYKKIKFKKIFSSEKCIHSKNNQDNNFEPHSSGGRIVNYDDDHILLSVGEFLESWLAQEKNNINGKIIKINKKKSTYEIISMGHRNPQGLFLDKENKFILETEHGPIGGDEINLINLSEINYNNPPNYGWAIVSDGEHYGSKNKNSKKYKKYPLYKSHTKYGFIEPIKSFVPSIGISEITKIQNKKYVVSSLKNESLYFFELNEENKLININSIKVFERIRDIKFHKNALYLFLEDTASLGIIRFP